MRCTMPRANGSRRGPPPPSLPPARRARGLSLVVGCRSFLHIVGLNLGVRMEELPPPPSSLEPVLVPVQSLVAERLFRARTVIISGEINQRLAANVAAQLVALP